MKKKKWKWRHRDNREYMIKILAEDIAMFLHIPSIDNGQMIARDIYATQLKARGIHWRTKRWNWSVEDQEWLFDYSRDWMDDYRRRHP